MGIGDSEGIKDHIFTRVRQSLGVENGAVLDVKGKQYTRKVIQGVGSIHAKDIRVIGDIISKLGKDAEVLIDRLALYKNESLESTLKQLDWSDVSKLVELRSRGKVIGDSCLNEGVSSLNGGYTSRCNTIINAVISARETSAVGSRSDSLIDNSSFMISAYKILDNDMLLCTEKQVCLEILSLYHEINFVKEVISNMIDELASRSSIESSSGAYSSSSIQIFVKLFSKSYGYLQKRLNTIMENYNIIQDPVYKKLVKAGLLSGKAKLVVILYLLGVERVSNIAFNVVVYLTGQSGGVVEMDIITMICSRLVNHVKSIKISGSTTIPEKIVATYEKHKVEITHLSPRDMLDIGQTLLDIVLSCYSHMFDKEVTYVDGKKHNHILIKDGLHSYISNIIFNPARLPMVSPPKRWGRDRKGGYIFEPFNIISNTEVLHQQSNLKISSDIGDVQYDTVNFLNNQGFVINKLMLEFLTAE